MEGSKKPVGGIRIKSKFIRLLIYSYLHFKDEVLQKVMLLSKSERALVIQACVDQTKVLNMLCKKQVMKNLHSSDDIRKNNID